MGFTEANGWTIVNGQPLLSWQEEAKTAGNSGSSNNTTGFSGSSNYGLQVGIDGKNSSRIEFSINLSYDLSVVSDNISSDEALSAIDNFIAQLSEQSTVLGSVQNRLESVLEEITIQRDNLVSSRSTIKDADIAEVSSTYIQQQILQQASATLLATANQTPSIALQLI